MKTTWIGVGAMLGGVLLSSGTLHALDRSWTGKASTNDWTQSSNWSGSLTYGPSLNLTFTGSSRNTPYNNNTAGKDVGNITFANTNLNFDLKGNSIDLFGSITNATAKTQEISLALRLSSGSQVIDAASASIWVSHISEYQVNGGIIKRGENELRLQGTSNAYTGPTAIEAGTLNLYTNSTSSNNNSIAQSPTITIHSGATLDVARMDTIGGFILASDQTLKGSGNVVGTLTAPTGSTIAPGLSPGTLSTQTLVLAGGTLSVEVVDSTSFDSLTVTGPVSITQDSPLAIDLTNLAQPLAPGTMLFLIDNDGQDAISLAGLLTYAGETLDQGAEFELAPGTTAMISYEGDKTSNSFLGGNDLVLQITGEQLVSPEPATGLLLTAATLTAVHRRRRRR